MAHLNGKPNKCRKQITLSNVNKEKCNKQTRYNNVNNRDGLRNVVTLTAS